MSNTVTMITQFLLSFLLLFLLCPAFAAPPAAPSTLLMPREVVRQFLEVRAAGQADKMQTLLSETTALVPGHLGHLTLDAQAYSQGATPAQTAVLSLLYDPQNKLEFKFKLLDTDPDFPDIVRVQATPASGPALTLQVVVEPDTTAADALRVDELLTLNCADPRILLPIVKRLQHYANQALSQQHLLQLSIAAIQYAQDYDEKMPDAAHWVDELMPYVKKDLAVFHDPSTPSSQKWGYSYNANLSGKSIAQLSDPTKTVLFFESASAIKNASDTGLLMVMLNGFPIVPSPRLSFLESSRWAFRTQTHRACVRVFK